MADKGGEIRIKLSPMGERMKLDVEDLIESGTNLPSLPGVAVQIIRLANNPDTTADEAVSLLYKDPAITSKLLRAVNSAVYAKPRQVESLKQAVVIMGLNSALTLALSFNLVETIKQQAGGGLDYELYWRRSLLSAISARVIGISAGVLDVEELFLAALLQDIGMLVLDRIDQDFYTDLGEQQADEVNLLLYEHDRLDVDHAYIGGLLLTKWQFPERTSQTVFSSHDPMALHDNKDLSRFASCVALSSAVADLFLGPDKYRQYGNLVSLADEYLQMKEIEVQDILEKITDKIPATEALFSTQLLTEEETAEIIRQARESMHKHAAAS